jgi:hypothetical protein
MISLQASSCPSCGAPPAKRGGASRPVLIIGIIALGVLLIIAASQHSSSPGKPPVKAQVALTGSAVVLRNLDDFTWPKVTLYLNGIPLDGYKVIYDRAVAPHQEISVPLIEFARADRRFNPFERKVLQVMVWAEGHDAPIFSFR